VTDLRISQVDPHDGAAFDAWHAVYLAADTFDREHWASPWTLAEYRAAGVEFARRHGYALGLGDVMRVLDLPVDDGLLDRLRAEAAPHHAAYVLRCWAGPVPGELAADWASLNAALDTQAPTGELVKQEMAADVAALRAREATMAAQQRTSFHAVAVARDGRLAAYNQLGPVGGTTADCTVRDRSPGRPRPNALISRSSSGP